MTNRRLGRVAVRRLAASPSLESALSASSRTAYGHDLHVTDDLATAAKGCGRVDLWNVRVLAGVGAPQGVGDPQGMAGSPRGGERPGSSRSLEGVAVGPPYRLGGLSTAWPARREGWQRGGGQVGPRDFALGGPGRRFTTRHRAHASDVSRRPGHRGCARGCCMGLRGGGPAGGTRGGPRPPGPAARRAEVGRPGRRGARAEGGLGAGARGAGPGTQARWALDGVHDADDLWRAEGRWWARVERDGFALVRRPTAAGGPGRRARDAGRRRLAGPGRARTGGSGRRPDGGLRCGGVRR